MMSTQLPKCIPKLVTTTHFPSNPPYTSVLPYVPHRSTPMSQSCDSPNKNLNLPRKTARRNVSTIRIDRYERTYRERERTYRGCTSYNQRNGNLCTKYITHHLALIPTKSMIKGCTRPPSQQKNHTEALVPVNGRNEEGMLWGTFVGSRNLLFSPA